MIKEFGRREVVRLFAVTGIGIAASANAVVNAAEQVVSTGPASRPSHLMSQGGFLPGTRIAITNPPLLVVPIVPCSIEFSEEDGGIKAHIEVAVQYPGYRLGDVIAEIFLLRLLDMQGNVVAEGTIEVSTKDMKTSTTQSGSVTFSKITGKADILAHRVTGETVRSYELTASLR